MIPYSQQFSMLKIFADFTGLSTVMKLKLFSLEISNPKQLQCMAGKPKHEYFIHENLFLSRIWQKKYLGYVVVAICDDCSCHR